MTDDVLGVALSRTVRLRPDIQWSLFSDTDQSAWVARDPISLEYFHFSQLEKSIVCQLDGSRDLRELLASHERSVSAEWLVQLVQRIERACLLVPTAIGVTGGNYWRAQGQQARQGLLQRLMSPLAVRVKLFDPTRLLSYLSPLAGILFSRTVAVVWLAFGSLIGLSVLLRIVRSPNAITDSLTTISTTRALGIVLIYVCVKSLHELGHALACKKWRAECHEIGVFFLVFTPCLYCNTSDSWKLPSRWRRACIAAAGIYVELILASIAGCLWLLTPAESLVHLLAANTMIVCSVSTVVVNANPLLRYDGYYVLSDLWCVPNLAEQSREAMRALAIASMTEKSFPQDGWDADPRLLAAYGFAAWIYRHFVVLVIAWVIWTLLDRLGVPLLGAFLVLFTIGNVVLANLIGLTRWIKELLMTGCIRMFRFTAFFVCLILAVVTVTQARWRTYVSGRAFTSYASMTPLYANQTGALTEFVSIGQTVTAGAEIAKLDSPTLRLDLIDAQGDVAVLEQRRDQLHLLSVDDDSTATELATVVEELLKARERLMILETELASLVIVANSDGVLLAGDYHSVATLTEPPNVQHSEPILSDQNLNSVVQRGTLLGWLSRSDGYDITAIVVEHDAKILRQGMPVRCRWDSALGTLHRGQVLRISPEPVSVVPDLLIGDESIAFRTAKDGRLKPEQPHYEVTIEMRGTPRYLGHNALATVHFETEPRTLYQSLNRLFDRHVRPSL